MLHAKFVQKLMFLLALAFVSVAGTTGVQAQNPYSAAYLVNGRIISHFDISQRQKLLAVLGAPATRSDAVDQLIDDRLKVLAAESFGLSVEDDQLQNSIDTIAKAQGTSGAALWAKARGRGVSREAFEDYFVAQLYWRQIIQGRFRAMAGVTDRELDEALQTIVAPPGQTSYLIGEIALPFAERGEAQTLAFANRLSNDLNSGASFETAVKTFSRSATAAKGGVLGWVDPSRLPPNIAPYLRGVSKGQVSAPIRVGSGVLILKVLDVRSVSSPLQKETSLTYAVLDLSGQVDALNLARRLLPEIDECSPKNSLAAKYGGASGKTGPTAPNNVPSDIALTLARLADSEAQILANGGNVRIVQLCDRQISLND
ncbi:MAG TPA: peptidylprolyl isomerase, partial [Paracoccaceae bacterium]|nr:peptidylprolyl isomerase [Paracoccaceae bacterium]